MNIEPIGATAAALSLTAHDLSRYGFDPCRLTLDQALRLTRDGLAAAGLSLPGALELEAFPDGEGVLILARALPQCPPRSIPVRACRRGRVHRRPT